MLHTFIYISYFLFDNFDSILDEDSSSSDSYNRKYNSVKDMLYAQKLWNYDYSPFNWETEQILN